jgi:hypothetical protein
VQTAIGLVAAGIFVATAMRPQMMSKRENV